MLPYSRYLGRRIVINRMHLTASNIEQHNLISRVDTRRSISDEEASNVSSTTTVSYFEADPKSVLDLHDNRSSLEKLLDLKQVSKDTFVNTGELFIPYRGRGLFGGTMAAQATLAALKYTNTVDKSWKPISLQCHFLHAAQPTPTLYYKVTSLKEGKNYCTREVSLFQNERLIYKATVTLQAYELGGSASNLEGQLNHHKQGPIIGTDIGHPDEMYSQEEVFKIWSKKAMEHKHLEYLKGEAAEKEVIKCYNREPCVWKLPLNMFDLDLISNKERSLLPSERTLRYWVKTKEKLNDPKLFNWAALAYISDYFFLSTNMRLNMREMFTTKFSVSLDHTIYFNSEIDTSEYFSYNVKSIKAGENRSIMMGEMYSATGDLAATTIQEGLSVVFTD